MLLSKIISFKVDTQTESELIAIAKGKDWKLSHLVRSIILDHLKKRNN